MDCSFAQVPIAYPSLYKIKLDQLQELQRLYREVVLPGVVVGDVEQELGKYVGSFIEPVGWQAIWRASPRSSGLSFKCDLLVEIIDVSRNELDALISIKKVLSSQLEGLDDLDGASVPSGDSSVDGSSGVAAANLSTDEQALRAERNELHQLINKKRVLNAPLIELYVINENDPDEQYLKSAIVIEHARFFLKYIWRPWDTLSNETQLSEIFVETRLDSRLNLYFDLKNGTVTGPTKNRIKQILAEGWQTRFALDDISRRQEMLESDLTEEQSEIAAGVGGDEDEDEEEVQLKRDASALDEVDMFEAIRLKIRLEDLDREMRMIEDPYLRVFAYCLRSRSQEEEEAKIELENQHVLHVVARQFTLLTLTQVTSFYSKSEKDQQRKILFHQSLNAAIKSARKGHKIALLPGHYICDSLNWIEHDIEIEGLSCDRSKTVLQANENVDIMLHCSANLTLHNLTIRCPSEADCLLMAHTGHIELKNCCLDGTHCTKGAYVVLSRAHVVQNETLLITREAKHKTSNQQTSPSSQSKNMDIDNENIDCASQAQQTES